MKQLFYLTILLSAFVAAMGQLPFNTSVIGDCYKKILPKDITNPKDLIKTTDLADKTIHCIEKSIYKSENLIDQIIMKNINIENTHNAVDYLHSKYDIVNTQNLTCLSDFPKCLSLQRGIPTGCLNGLIPCIYKVMTKCSPKGAMIFSKVLKMVKSTACTLSSYHYNMVPFYGPGMHCYPNVEFSSDVAAAKLGFNYKNFCAGFRKEEVSQCIEDELRTKKASFLLDADYIRDAKVFFRQRSTLCEYMNSSAAKSCPDVTVLSCQKDLLKGDNLEKPRSVVLKMYASCVYDKYKQCDQQLAKVIKDNLSGIDGIGSNAGQLSVSFVLIVCQTAIIMSFFV